MTSFATDLTASAELRKPVLKQGSQGEVVKELQGLLLSYGAFVIHNGQGNCVFPGKEVVDGVFGAKTTAAVKVFQGRVFQTQDGIVGDKVWRSLFKGAPVDMVILKKGAKGELVKKVQERLAIAGYYNYILEGDFGSRTEAAVKEFQKAVGLPVDGVIAERTWFELSKINTIFCS
ncbi:peptidoglycan-binding domain-containing protein [Calothrix sp. 336/3]|uniref:peptidoglycan-binding domain-containing protein n=1 Tax=Calothrix sp. 336/3 TaxID=1337936 RepID=UPI0004E42AFD|nr:peptidoglycan-binding protein [Calothrix sp. 336/3]AKG20661.1 peptidoglycan-binding protein [Calothrix sp. 336/3]